MGAALVPLPNWEALMSTVTKTQSLLLHHAARRENGSLFPLPEDLTHPPTIRRSVAAMLGRGWLKARPTADQSAVAHSENNERYGVFITPEGCAAINVKAHEVEVEHTARVAQPATKAAQVIALLLREEGATLTDLAQATGWLPHTTRAALTSLRKKGHHLAKAKQPGGPTFYRIIAQ
ncbi:DUF3489 domain-containing protein [Sphingomonas sp. NBWT7]|uniref:DUF3489 domain-containing protein n=1 Tax=Sphingomonas sp. NBWT7 TaxID=2596913 RepID=UPI0016274383|nr:DUF3489 domain-containing protein [Sphingomonas sp. NBWT7]